jgi:hypothetical protein
MTYSINYVDNPAEVDIYKRSSKWGQIDYWTRSIRIYDNGRAIEDIWQTILHEVIHGIAEALNLSALNADEAQIDLLALALSDIFFRNSWIRLEDMET